jgi:trigger factor
MTVTAELIDLEDDHKVRLDVAVPEDEVREKAQRAVRALGRNIRMPGFRPGKAPSGMILNAVGRDAVLERMIRDSLGEWYEKALDATGVSPIDDPELDLPEVTDEGPINFSATVRRRPTASLGEYKGLEVVRPDADVTEAMVEIELGRLREQLGRLEPVERAAASGDFVTMDFDGLLDGEPVPSATGRDYVVELGAGRLIAGFDEALEGASAGDVREFALDYPDDDHRGELSGKTVSFTVTVKRVQERILPELDDTFASDATGFDSLEGLRADLRQRMEAALSTRADEQYRRLAIDAAVEKATVDIPEVMVSRRVDSILHDTSHQLPQGVTLQDYLRAQGRTLEQARADLAGDAEMSIRRELVVEAIIAAEGIEVTEETIEGRVEQEATAAGRDPKQIMKNLRKTGNLAVLREDLAREQAVDVIVSSAVALTVAEAEAKGLIPSGDGAADAPQDEATPPATEETT